MRMQANFLAVTSVPILLVLPRIIFPKSGGKKGTSRRSKVALQTHTPISEWYPDEKSGIIESINTLPRSVVKGPIPAIRLC